MSEMVQRQYNAPDAEGHTDGVHDCGRDCERHSESVEGRDCRRLHQVPQRRSAEGQSRVPHDGRVGACRASAAALCDHGSRAVGDSEGQTECLAGGAIVGHLDEGPDCGVSDWGAVSRPAAASRSVGEAQGRAGYENSGWHSGSGLDEKHESRLLLRNFVQIHSRDGPSGVGGDVDAVRREERARR